MHPEPIEFAPRRGSTWLGLGGSLLFVALGLFLILGPGMEPSAHRAGALNVLFFGTCAFVYARGVFQAPVALRLDSAGLHYRHPRREAAFRVAWSEIAAIRARQEERASLVTLVLRGPEGRPEVTLSATALGTTAEMVVADVERFRRYYGRSASAPRAE